MTRPYLRWELRDTEHPTWKGSRYSDATRARRALVESWEIGGAPRGRFEVVDRTTGEVVDR